MSELQISSIFIDGETVDAPRFNTNNSDIVTYVNNRNSGASTWDSMYCTHATNIPIIANNSTGTQDIFQAKDNGINVFTINDGGYINAPYQDYAYTSKLGVGQIYGAGPAKINDWDLQSQTQSGMDSSGKFTAAVAGKYLVMATIGWSALSGSNELSTFYIYVNGVSVAKSVGIGINSVTRNWTVLNIVSLTAGDYVEIYGASASGFVVDEVAGSTRFYVLKMS